MIAHAGKRVFRKFVKIQVYQFSWEHVHIRVQPAEEWHFLNYFSNFLNCFQIVGKIVDMTLHTNILNYSRPSRYMTYKPTRERVSYFCRFLWIVYHTLAVQIRVKFGKFVEPYLNVEKHILADTWVYVMWGQHASGPRQSSLGRLENKE